MTNKPKIFRFYSKPDRYPRRIAVIGEFKDGILNIAASICSTKDRYLKSTARAVAEGRLLKKRLYAYREIPECKTEDFILIADKICSDISKHRNATPEKPYNLTV